MYENNGSVKKLLIEAYKDPKFSQKKADSFTTLLNPEKYSINYKTEYKDDSAAGTGKSSPKFIRSLPQDLDLEFLFDRTGILPPVPSGVPDTEKGAKEDVNQFKKVAFDYDGEDHKPSYLIISWGTLCFPCQLTEMNVEYRLFAPDGRPLRAVVKAKFKYFIDEDKAFKEDDDQSPDLTHYRLVKEGDTLPLMTFKIYGDSKYYAEVARVNKLSSFRKLVPGQRLFFPPLEKQGV